MPGLCSASRTGPIPAINTAMPPHMCTAIGV
jgi:hypothetical protein